MRQLFAGLCAGLLLLSNTAAQTLRVVTWQADDFPSVSTSAGTNDVDLKRLRLAGAALKSYQPDIIVLEGMPDRNSCTRLAGLLKPLSFQLVTYNTFRGASNVAVARSLAVLARKAVGPSRTVEWKSSGQVDAAGGFCFSTLAVGTNTVCLYAGQFVDAAGSRTNTRLAQLNARKRELSAQYLLHHAKWLEGTLTNGNAVFLVLGNLADGLALWPGDASARILEQAGWRGNPLVPASEPAAHPYPQVFARHAVFAGIPSIGAPRGFGTGPVAYELSVKFPEPPPVVASVPPMATVAVRPSTAANRFPVDERFLWLAAPVAAAVALFLIILLPYRWIAWRRQSRALVPARPASNAVVVDFATQPEDPAALEAGRPPAGQLADAPPEERHAAVREGLMPALVRLMREKIFQRLSSQRAHLIDSHVAGTMQVLELEERLEKIQSGFQARLAAREQRVAELEKELAAKDNFIRELLKAQAGKSVNQ